MAPVLTIAHRAGNSLSGLHAANELGVDVIEADIHHYRGRLEVRHLKTAGPLPFLWDKGELVRGSAPRLGLHELLEADEHGTLFMLDIKGPWTWAGRDVARMLHDGGHQAGGTSDDPVVPHRRSVEGVVSEELVVAERVGQLHGPLDRSEGRCGIFQERVRACG